MEGHFIEKRRSHLSLTLEKMKVFKCLIIWLSLQIQCILSNMWKIGKWPRDNFFKAKIFLNFVAHDHMIFRIFSRTGRLHHSQNQKVEIIVFSGARFRNVRAKKVSVELCKAKIRPYLLQKTFTNKWYSVYYTTIYFILLFRLFTLNCVI